MDGNANFMPKAGSSYRPPAPFPKPTLSRSGDDLLGLISESFFYRGMIRLPGNGRDVLIVNEPGAIRQVLSISVDAFPKSDLMVTALKPLLGNGILLTDGTDWDRQRRMLGPALEQMRVRRIYPLMLATVTDFVRRLRSLGNGAEIVLDAEMSFVALDIIFRAIFSRPISVEETVVLSNAFAEYQEKLPQDVLIALFGDSGAARIPFHDISEIAARIRSLIASLVDERLSVPPGEAAFDDILQAAINARDPQDGSGFTRDELIDQVTVLFMAGHESSASALTWSIFLLSQQSQIADSIREEVIALRGAAPLKQDVLTQVTEARNVFRETLRLYPPAGFISRVATTSARIGGYDVSAGSLIVISPWLLHRHRKYWGDADLFDPDRFSPEREREMTSGAYIPFGLGGRVCTGRTIAMIEGPLVITELMQAFRFTTLQVDTVMPAFRLTVRPKSPIRCRVDILPSPRSLG